MAEALTSNSASSASGPHHIGVTVASLEKALTFRENFLGKPAQWKADQGARVAYLRIHDGVTLEILQPAPTEQAPR